MLKEGILLVVVPLKIIRLGSFSSPYWRSPYKWTFETSFAKMQTASIDEIRNGQQYTGIRFRPNLTVHHKAISVKNSSIVSQLRRIYLSGLSSNSHAILGLRGPRNEKCGHPKDSTHQFAGTTASNSAKFWSYAVVTRESSDSPSSRKKKKSNPMSDHQPEMEREARP